VSTLRFNLRTDKPAKFSKCPVELIYQISGERKKIWLEFKLHPLNWDPEDYKVVYISKRDARKLYPEIDFDLTLLDNSEVEAHNLSIQQLKRDINDIEKQFEYNKELYSVESVIERLKSKRSGKTRREEPKNYLFDFIDQYITDHKDSRVPGSLSVYKSLKSHLEAFQKETKHRVKFEQIDYVFFQKFQNFLITRTKTLKDGSQVSLLNNTTIAKVLRTLKTFLGYAAKNGIKINERYRHFSIKKDSLEVIALTEEEFTTLLNWDLSQNKKLDKVRDIFCFSCATGLRISDMQQLRREHIKGDEINLSIRKTKRIQTIPLNPISGSILQKYENQLKPLPLISSQKLNEYLKELCELAKIDEPIEIVRFKGAKREAIVYPKYKLIHIHTGRKTFATLSLEKGMSAEQVMYIGGWSSYASFKRYVNITKKLSKAVMAKAWGEPVTNHLKVV
jgi:integrase